MPHINTLIADCKELLTTKEWFTDALAKDFSSLVAKRLQEQFQEKSSRLRLSAMGDQCPCALWHSINKPELMQPFRGETINMFSIGHIIEAWAITLAKATGHSVEGEQDELDLDGILGHRDCVIDGCTVDVKSVSSRSYPKYINGTADKDYFIGRYLAQLDGYVVASATDPLVRVKDVGYLWVVDKQLGKMHLYEHHIRAEKIRDTVREYKAIVQGSTAPACNCGTRPEGRSGNIILDTAASYNVFKYGCFPHIRCFVYKDGPVYFTRVVKRPMDALMEVDRHGKRIG